MFLQRMAAAEEFPTLLAEEGFLSRVRHHVAPQVPLVLQPRSADQALHGRPCHVSRQVLRQLWSCRAALVTQRAGEQGRRQLQVQSSRSDRAYRYSGSNWAQG